MFLWYKYLIFTLVFSHLGFWSGNLSLIALFPDLPSCTSSHIILGQSKLFEIDNPSEKYKLLGIIKVFVCLC